MNKQRTLIALAWIASIVVAYLVGGTGTSVQTNAPAGEAKTNAASAAANAGVDKESRAMVRKMDDLAEGEAGARPNVATLIAKARLEMGSGMGGMMNIRSMLRAIAPIAELDDSQIMEALAEVEKTVREPQQKMMFYSLLLGQWAEKDGKAALAYAEEKLGGSSPFDFGVRATILGTWARRDPDAAWRWYQTERKPEDNERTMGMSVNMIFAGMASSDLDSALQRVAALDDTTRAMALQGIAGSATNDASRKRLIDRATGLPQEQRAQIYQGLVGPWAMMDSEAAVKWIRTLPAEEQKPLRDSAGQMMMMMKPALGAELLLEGAEEKDKPQIYDRVAGQWAFQDARAAGEWLMKQPQGPELDGARRSYAMAVVNKDAAGAMDWAKSVQKPEQREQAVEQVFQVWRGKDTAAAEAALESAGLPPEKVQKLKESKPPVKTGAMRLGF
jgi:hypothetical protein